MAKSTEKQKQQMKEYHQANKEKIHLRKKKYCIKNKEKIKQKMKEWYEKNKTRTTHTDTNVDPIIKVKARRYAHKMKSKKSTSCEICGSTENLETHHWKYTKPYKNTWNVLCSTCHDIQHVRHFDKSRFATPKVEEELTSH